MQLYLKMDPLKMKCNFRLVLTQGIGVPTRERYEDTLHMERRPCRHME